MSQTSPTRVAAAPAIKDEYSLFNAMDGSLLDLSSNAFDESLTLNILFQGKILVNEASFLNCPRLVEHLSSRPGHQSLFEAACKSGLIVPALRNPAFQSLEEAASAMQRVYGADYAVTTPGMDPFRDRIIAAVDSSIVKGITVPFYWPTDIPPLGEGYGEVVRRVLQTDSPPAYTLHSADRALLFQRVWERTKRWRFDLVEEAALRTTAKGAAGLQRAEVFNLLGWSLGVATDVKTVSAEMIVGACNDPEVELAAKLFIKWMSQCHHLNQARSFGTSINFPIYNIDQDFILDSILRSPLDPPPNRSKGFRCEVNLPAIQRLAEASPADLISIRNEIGHGYLHSLRKWQVDPTDATEDAVQSSLRLYCDNITARYKEIRVAPLEVAITNGPGSIKIKNITNVAGKIYDLVQPFNLPVLHQVTTLGTVLYRTIKASRVKSAHGPKAQQLEVTLSTDIDL